LVSAIVFHSQKIGKPINGFIMRKSRKPYDLQKIIEGKINKEKIILVDDLINRGITKMRQIKVLENIKKKVDYVFTIANFRGEENTEILRKKNIELFSLFNLEDLDLKLSKEEKNNAPVLGFSETWHFQSPNPAFFHRLHKSTPVIDEKKIYFGADNGNLWALNQEDGSIIWKFDETGYPTTTGKIIFSSPALYKNMVYFGAYDGNIYAVDKNTGKIRWKYMNADYIGSSPAIAPDLGLLFIGLEFGLLRKKGGLAALNLETGQKVWDVIMTDFVHCSPAYCSKKKVVAVGGNDSYVYLFNAKNGKLKWKFKTGEVKASLIFDTKRNLLIFGSFDKNLYALDIDSGEIKGKFPTRDLIYSTPEIYENNVYFGSMDKNLYSLNLDTGKLNWHHDLGGRIFSRPKIVEGKIYIGSTKGVMEEIDANTGKPLSYFMATERITNEVIYNQKTKSFFLPTYANEIYCLKKA
jgi:outer membrane protein assembly factor BamB